MYRLGYTYVVFIWKKIVYFKIIQWWWERFYWTMNKMWNIMISFYPYFIIWFFLNQKCVIFYLAPRPLTLINVDIPPFYFWILLLFTFFTTKYNSMDCWMCAVHVLSREKYNSYFIYLFLPIDVIIKIILVILNIFSTIFH